MGTVPRLPAQAELHAAEMMKDDAVEKDDAMEKQEQP